MKKQILAVGLFVLFMGGVAAQGQEFFILTGDVPAGTPVIALVDNPSSSTCIQQGDSGVVVCSEEILDPLWQYWIEWDAPVDCGVSGTCDSNDYTNGWQCLGFELSDLVDCDITSWLEFFDFDFDF